MGEIIFKPNDEVNIFVNVGNGALVNLQSSVRIGTMRYDVRDAKNTKTNYDAFVGKSIWTITNNEVRRMAQMGYHQAVKDFNFRSYNLRKIKTGKISVSSINYQINDHRIRINRFDTYIVLADRYVTLKQTYPALLKLPASRASLISLLKRITAAELGKQLRKTKELKYRQKIIR